MATHTYCANYQIEDMYWSHSWVTFGAYEAIKERFFTLFYTRDLLLSGIGRLWAAFATRKRAIFPLEPRLAVLGGVVLSTLEACALTEMIAHHAHQALCQGSPQNPPLRVRVLIQNQPVRPGPLGS